MMIMAAWDLNWSSENKYKNQMIARSLAKCNGKSFIFLRRMSNLSDDAFATLLCAIGSDLCFIG